MAGVVLNALLCWCLGHKLSDREVECDMLFTEVTFYCSRCPRVIQVLPWEEAPLRIRHKLVGIAEEFKKRGLLGPEELVVKK